MTLRRRGGNTCPEGEPVCAVIRRTDGTVTGIDMNAGQVAIGDGPPRSAVQAVAAQDVAPAQGQQAA